MALHEVQLKGYSVRPGNLSLGTFDSYGIEQLHVTADDSWDGLDILAVFHAPNGDAKKVVVGADGMLNVPPEATAKQAGNGRIVFVGLAENVQRITVDMGYNIKTHSDIEGDNPGVPTPDVVQQILQAALNAEQNSAEAKSVAEGLRNDAASGKFDGKDGAKGDKGETGTTPQLKIGEDNLWQVSYDNGATWVSLGVKATGEAGKDGEDGKNGLTPHIGENGNWWVGDTDTGVSAKGDRGDTGAKGADGVSPTASVTQTDDGAKFTVTDASGTTTAMIRNGTDGRDGAPGAPGKDAVVDATLTQDGQAADAKVTGKKIGELKEDATALQKRQNVLVGSETGNPASCNDAFAAPLCGLTIYGKSTQVSTTGAQLISLNDSYGVTTINGVTKTPIGISAWKLEGIAKENTTIYPYSSASFLSLSKGDYVFSVFGTSKARARYVIIGGTSSEYIQTGRSLKISLQEDVKLVFNFMIKNGVESDGILMIMLNSGSASLPWEPYTGGEPSPSPNYPQEIESAGDGGSVVMTLSNGNDKTQTLALPTPNGLPGIPVTSGGNYTDQNGQQWVCDEADLERGVKVQRVNVVDLSTCTITGYTKLVATKRLAILLPLKAKDYTVKALCNRLPYLVSFTSDTIHFYVDTGNAQVFIPIDAKNPEEGEYILFYVLATPIETPLTPAEIAAYKALTAYAPDTVVQVSDGAGIKLDYQRDVNLVVKNLEDAIASMTTT